MYHAAAALYCCWREEGEKAEGFRIRWVVVVNRLSTTRHLAVKTPTIGGERGIRTPGDREATTVFKTDAIVRSAISPQTRIANAGHLRPDYKRWQDRSTRAPQVGKCAAHDVVATDGRV